ncbi:hypothetical protein FQN49_007616 [Arthroderma sp. PD_2]|nr:hypothetical protein FQN49_007616 [Arthroderma sp. PD_2]
MLVLNPKDRPKIGQVTESLRKVATEADSEPIFALYQSIYSQNQSTALGIEHERFASWARVIGICPLRGASLSTISVFHSDSVFRSTLDILSQILLELQGIQSRPQNAGKSMWHRLRLLNNRLVSLLSAGLQDQVKRHFEVTLLQTEDISLLQETQLIYEDTSRLSKVGMLAALKHMSQLVDSFDPYSELHLDPEQVKYAEDLDEYTLAWVKGKEGTRYSLIEWVQYDSHWAGEVADELVSRVKARAVLLNSAKLPQSFLALHCTGWYHAVERGAFGLVFQYPCLSDATKSPVRPLSLARLIRDSLEWRIRPSLGDRFRLARDLATSVLDFHKIGWLHKTISSFSIVFFTDYSPATISLCQPFLIGFGHSRPDQKDVYTEGPNLPSNYLNYQEPKYINGETTYLPTCDYYSLGIVLLEIGLWKPLADITKKSLGSPEKTRQYLLENRVPLLSHSMGNHYRDAVWACLSGEFSTVSENASVGDRGREAYNTSIYLSFGELVVDRLANCMA